MLDIYEQLNLLEEEQEEESRDIILDEIESLTHIYSENEDEETVVTPWYCMLNTIASNYGYSEKEMSDLAESNGYIILKIPTVSDFEGGLAIADKDVNLDAVKADIKKAVEDDYSEVSDFEITVKGRKAKEEPKADEVEVETEVEKAEVEENLKEEFARVDDKSLEQLEHNLESNGFDIVSKRDYGHYGDDNDQALDIHYQIITKEGNQTKESYEEKVQFMEDLLDEFEEMTGSPCTFNMGLQYDGYISCGFDVRAVYYKPGEDYIPNKPIKLSFRSGKPADEYTKAQLKDIAKKFNVSDDEIASMMPVDHPKNEDLNEKAEKYDYKNKSIDELDKLGFEGWHNILINKLRNSAYDSAEEARKELSKSKLSKKQRDYVNAYINQVFGIDETVDNSTTKVYNEVEVNNMDNKKQIKESSTNNSLWDAYSYETKEEADALNRYYENKYSDLIPMSERK